MLGRSSISLLVDRQPLVSVWELGQKILVKFHVSTVHGSYSQNPKLTIIIHSGNNFILLLHMFMSYCLTLISFCII